MQKYPMTVGDLLRALRGVPHQTPIVLEIFEPEDGTDLAQATLRDADVEARCNEIDTLYLSGNCEDDKEEMEEKAVLRLVKP
jgi:hypothetical protein